MADSQLDGLSGGQQQEERQGRYDYSSLSVIPISQAARLHEGYVKTRGVISAISPLTKLVESFYYECESCHQLKEIPGIKWADGKPI
jgi:hypothetical protein